MALLLIIIALIINLLVAKFPMPQKIYANKYLFISFYFVLGAIIGLRGINDGLDTISYYETYNLLSNYSLYEVSLVSHMEIGYLLINKIFQFFGFSYHTFQFVFSVSMMLLFGIYIYKNTKDVYFATLIFLGAGFFAFSFNIVRQMMAIAICSNSWIYLRVNRNLKFLFLILIASSFHLMSLLFIIPFILYKYRANRILRYGFTISILCLTLLLPMIFNYLQKYNIYDSYTNLDNTGIKGGFIYFLWIIEFGMAFIILFIHAFSDIEKVVANLALFSVVLTMMDEKVRYLDRIGLIFFPFVILLFCIIGDNIRDSNLRFMYFLFFSLFFFIFFIYRSSEIANFTLSF